MFNSIIPVIETYANKNDFGYIVGVDEIFIDQYFGDSSIRTRLEFPFNGHILLALTFLIASRNKKFIRILIIYQLALFFIIPLLGWLLINGNIWASFMLNFHEKAHKVGFLILGLLSIKSKADSVSAGKILNK